MRNTASWPKLVLLFWLFVANSIAIGQNQDQLTDSQLAMQYYRLGVYQKAADLFEKLYQKGRSDFYYGD